MCHHSINPCAATVFSSIFHSFEAGIADAICIFKRKKNMYVQLTE